MNEAHEHVTDSAGLTDSVQISTRHYIASQHLWAAQHQARLCAEVEAEENAAPFDIRHRTFAIGAVLSSVAFLEALVNELFQDAADSEGAISGRIAPLGEKCIALMAEFWNATDNGARYIRALEKFQMALLFADKPRFDPGASPFQDVKLLIVIRNKLIHFRPAWQAQGDVAKEEQMLTGKFAENSLMAGMSSAWFPNKCLGAGCAEWAWRVSLLLADDWSARLNVPSSYRADLDTWPQP
jgi:hypothetical protein